MVLNILNRSSRSAVGVETLGNHKVETGLRQQPVRMKGCSKKKKKVKRLEKSSPSFLGLLFFVWCTRGTRSAARKIHHRPPRAEEMEDKLLTNIK